MPRSSPFVPGNKIKASDLNNLRDDVLSSTYGHTHTGGTDGKPIPHLESHISATNGVHGNISGDYIPGIRPDARMEYGSFVYTWSSGIDGSRNYLIPDTTISFGNAFGNPPTIYLSYFVTYTGNPPVINSVRGNLYPTDVTTTGFRVIFAPAGNYGAGASLTVRWFAVGS